MKGETLCKSDFIEINHLYMGIYFDLGKPINLIFYFLINYVSFRIKNNG